MMESQPIIVMGVAEKILKEYGGGVETINKESRNSEDLERRLAEFRGIGPVTVKRFLRELRGIWKNADPQPTKIEILAAKELQILTSNRAALKKLKEYWEENAVKGFDFRNFEAMLVRYGIELRRKKS